MRELLGVIEVSVADARQAEELFEKGARSTMAVDRERFLAMFGLGRSVRRVRVVREMPRRGSMTRSSAA